MLKWDFTTSSIQIYGERNNHIKLIGKCVKRLKERYHTLLGQQPHKEERPHFSALSTILSDGGSKCITILYRSQHLSFPTFSKEDQVVPIGDNVFAVILQPIKKAYFEMMHHNDLHLLSLLLVTSLRFK